MWTFCLRSLFREYGWRFAWRVAVRHPLRALDAIREANRLDASGDGVDVAGGVPVDANVGPPSIVGAGFGIAKVLPIAAASALVEAVSPHGWDNLTMQVIPSALAWAWLS